MPRLCINRKNGQSFRLRFPKGCDPVDVFVTVYRNGRDKFKFAIEAPEEVEIMRTELLNKEEAANA